MTKEKLTKQRKLWLKLTMLTKDYPTFETICVALLNKKEKELGDKYTIAMAQEDLWCIWCETYPDKEDFNLVNASEEHLKIILDYFG